MSEYSTGKVSSKSFFKANFRGRFNKKTLQTINFCPDKETFILWKVPE